LGSEYVLKLVCEMKKITVMVLVFFISMGTCSAQTTWERIYGGTGRDMATAMHLTDEGDIIIVGLYDYDLMIFKVGSNGDSLWMRRYDVSFYATAYEFLYSRISISPTSYEGYVILSERLKLLRIDDFGDTIGTSTLLENWGRNFSHTLMSDGGFIIIGLVAGMMPPTEYLRLVKADSMCELEWEIEYRDSFFWGDIIYGYDIVSTPSRAGCVLTGECVLAGAANMDVFAMKVNSGGGVVWKRGFGGEKCIRGMRISNTTDSSYIITGTAYRGDSISVYLIKVNSDGDSLWAHSYDEFEDCRGYAVKQTFDGGYIITGMTEFCDTVCLNDVYLIKTDSLGNALWSRTYGGSGNDIGYDVIQTDDCGFIILAQTNSFGSVSDDIYIIKTDSLGNVDWVKDIPGKPQEISLNVSPNPFNSSCAITVNVGAFRETPLQIKIFDLLGNLVSTFYSDGKPSSFVPLNKGDSDADLSAEQRVYIWHPDETIPSGLYLVKAKKDNGQTIMKKIILLR